MGTYSHFPQKPNPSPPTGSPMRNSPLIKTLVIGLFGLNLCAFLILLLLLCVYLIMRPRVYFMEFNRGSSLLRRREDTSTSRARIRGLDPKLVETLPTFLYTPQNLMGEEKIECSICLSEFEEGEKLKVLSNCDHSFHTVCIDMWFSSHSSCPVCRTHVKGYAQTIVVDNIEDSCSSNGNNNSVVVNIGVIEEGQGSGGSPRKSEDISSPTASNCGRFSRLHSLKRMLSKGKEEKVLASSLHHSPTGNEGQSQG